MNLQCVDTIDHRLATALMARRGKLTRVRDVNTSLGFRRSIETRDQLMTFDAATRDSAGAFLVGELERLDQDLHKPLVAVTWQRDIDIREDVSMADEASSFTNSTFASSQGIAGSNKSWASKVGSAMPSIALDIGKTLTDLEVWAQEISWTLLELVSAQKLGRPVDSQKYEMMLLKYQMDMDELTYMGDAALGMNGMFNHSSLTNTGNAVNGTWATASAAEILADVNAILTSVYETTGTALAATRLLLDPVSFGILVSTIVSQAGNISILEFLLRNNITNSVGNGQKLEIFPTKWLLGTGQSISGVPGRGPAATNSMFAYVKEKKRIRLPLVPLQRTPLENRGIQQLTTYFGRAGGVELVYSDTAARRSGL
jgi:hypothetical protein